MIYLLCRDWQTSNQNFTKFEFCMNLLESLLPLGLLVDEIKFLAVYSKKSATESFVHIETDRKNRSSRPVLEF